MEGPESLVLLGTSALVSANTGLVRGGHWPKPQRAGLEPRDVRRGGSSPPPITRLLSGWGTNLWPFSPLPPFPITSPLLLNCAAVE